MVAIDANKQQLEWLNFKAEVHSRTVYDRVVLMGNDGLTPLGDGSD